MPKKTKEVIETPVEMSDSPVKELTERQKWNKEWKAKAKENWDLTHPKKVKEPKSEGPRLPRTVKAMSPDEQQAWVDKQIEQLNKRLGELSALRSGTEAVPA